MKKIFIVIIAIIAPCLTSAQPANMDAFFCKYGGKPGFNMMNIDHPGTIYNPWQLFGFKVSGSENDRLNRIAKALNELKILIYNPKCETSSDLGNEFVSDIQKVCNFKQYDEFANQNIGDNKVKMIYKKSGDTVTELLITYISAENKSALFWIKGDIDFDNLSTIKTAFEYFSKK